MEIFPIHFEKLPGTVRVPQQGWNKVTAQPGCRILKSGAAYFSNSFATALAPVGWQHAGSALQPAALLDTDYHSSETLHGIQFVSAVERGAVVACQFHPELSGDLGRHIMKVLQFTIDDS